ncbi:MAG TPA: helix-turn-helix domain-containing protein [Chloroflexota bacterium]|jgi:hypothetical protein|nr:helix-turn-helix domain-containing protein [Chloroflexota bacterium]
MSAPDTTTVKTTLGLLLAQSRVLRALAFGSVLQGTSAELTERLDVGPDVFRAALQDLVEGGWIFVTTTRDGRLIVGRERRLRDDGPPGFADRRGTASRWEGARVSLGR